jgi:hypothetical protein
MTTSLLPQRRPLTRLLPLLMASVMAMTAMSMTATALHALDTYPELSTLMRPISGTIATGDPYFMVAPDQVGTVGLVLHNHGDQPMTGSLRIGVRERADLPDNYGAAQDISLAPGAEVRMSLSESLIGRTLGVRYCAWELTPTTGPVISGVTTFAVMVPVGITPGVSRGSFVLGNQGPHHWRMKDGPEKQAYTSKMLKAAALLGTESMRTTVGPGDGFGWSADPTTWDFTKGDATMAELESLGMEACALFGYQGDRSTKTPEVLARAAADKARDNELVFYPSDPEIWRQVVRTVATRYKGRIHRYEILNEPDLNGSKPFGEGWFRGTPAELATIQRIAYDEIKAIDPTAIVGTSGYGCTQHVKHHPEMVDAVRAEGKFDQEVWHIHGGIDFFIRGVTQHVLPGLKKAGLRGKPLYFTETSIGGTFNDEYTQTNVVQSPIFAWSVGARGWHFFTIGTSSEGYDLMRKRGYQSGDETWYRMFNHDLTPRPVVVSYNNFARLMRGRFFVQTLDVGAGNMAFAFSGKGDFSGSGTDDWVIPWWTMDSTAPQIPYVFHIGSGATAALVDVQGNRSDLPIIDGVVIASMSSDVSYVVIEGCPKLPTITPLITMPRATSVLAGGTESLTATVANPLARAVTTTLNWNATAQLSAEPARSQVPSQGTSVLPIALRAGADFQGQTMQGELRFTGTPWTAAVRIPVAVQQPLRTSGPDDRVADFILDKPSQVSDFAANDPKTAHLLWKNPADSSAKVWVWVADQQLHLRIDVRDDLPGQVVDPVNNSWQGDGVQVGIFRPGDTGWLEFGLSTSTKTSHAHVWSSANDRPNPWRSIVSTTSATPDGARYEFSMPLSGIGTDLEQLASQGIRINVLINDRDEDNLRATAIAIADGIVAKKDTLAWPLMKLVP